MATDLDRELLETVTSKQNKIRDFLKGKDQNFQDFAENYTEGLRKFFGQKPTVISGVLPDILDVTVEGTPPEIVEYS